MIKQDLPQFKDLIRTPDNKLAMRLFVYWGPVYVVPDHQIRSMSPQNVFGILTIYRVLPIVFLVMFCEFFGFSRVISTLFYPVAFLLGHSISVFRVCEGHRLTDTADCLELSSFERNYLAFLGVSVGSSIHW